MALHLQAQAILDAMAALGGNSYCQGFQRLTFC
jgi:hypothetical protein